MCVHVRPEMTQIAVLEGRKLIEHYVSRAADDANQIDGNIYRGRVQNVLPGMEAAFIDIGTPKNAVLYWGDVRYESDDVESGATPGPAADRAAAATRPDDPLPGDQEPDRGQGGPPHPGGLASRPLRRAGPDSRAYGISKRLDDGERKRLRQILDDMRPEGHGIIVRTAAEGASADELAGTSSGWWRSGRRSTPRRASSAAPALLYPSRTSRCGSIREELNRGVPRRGHRRPGALRTGPRLRRPTSTRSWPTGSSTTTPTAEALPVFERHHVHEQLHKALDRKVWLPSGDR